MTAHKNILLLILAVLSTFHLGYCLESNEEKIVINEHLHLIKITEQVYIHDSYSSTEENGGFWSNGLLIIEKDRAFLLDTPMDDFVTEVLLEFIQDSLHMDIVGFICNDWHGDSMEGLDIIKELGIPSYAHEMTRKICIEKGLPVPDKGFREDTIISFGGYKLYANYHGAAHTMDNIVIWIPKEGILFADCMIKALDWKTLGYVDDGDINEYPITLNKVKEAYPDAKYVIPGHGSYGGTELIDHTLKLTTQ